MVASRGLLEWIPLVEFHRSTLTLADPQGQVRMYHFPSGKAPVLSLFDRGGAPLPDGTYTWELRLTLGADAGSGALVQSGYFTVAEGSVVPPDLAEPPEGGHPSSGGPRATTAADQIVPDDFIVDGKGCIGLGCVNNEAFGTEALRLKQSVVRLRFEDTSTAGGFPARDWQLTVNDSASGGGDRFSIDDLTAATTPVTVRGGAPTNSLYIDGVGNLGLGSATPGGVFDLQRSSGSDILQRLWNTGSGGAKLRYVAATGATSQLQLTDALEWLSAIAGNNVIGLQFRVRDPMTANSEAQLAASPRMTILRNGNVGIGTTAPAHLLHVNGGNIAVTGGSFIDDGVTLNAPDYVFEPGYALMPLGELAAYVAHERHLPNVPSAADIKANGLNLSQFQMRLLEKIEELTLYAVAQEVHAQELRELVEGQQVLIEALTRRLDAVSEPR